MNKFASYILPGLSLCVLVGLAIAASGFRPLRINHLMQEQPLQRRLLTDSAAAYTAGYALPTLKTLKLHFDAALPDTVFLVPDSDNYLEIRCRRADEEPPVAFERSPLQEGKIVLNPYIPDEESIVMSQHFSVRLHFRDLEELEIALLSDPGFAPLFPILSEGPVRQKSFSFSYPKIAYPQLEFEGDRLTLEENGGGIALLSARESGRGYDPSRQAQFTGRARTVYAKDLTKACSLEGLHPERVALSANEYALIRTGSPRMLSVSHAALGYSLNVEGNTSKGQVLYRGRPAIREKYLAGRPTLELLPVAE